MNTRLSAVLSVVLLACTAAIAWPTSLVLADEPPAAAAVTEDVIYTTDGRVLHGKIVNETRSLVIFEHTDASVQLKTRITLMKDEIAHIDRNVPASAPAPAEKKPAATSSSKKSEPERTYGAMRAEAKAQNVPSFYIVPMKGQMGTDVRYEVYKRVKDDILQQKPDVIVIVMDCQDTEDVVYNSKATEEQGMVDIDDYRTLVKVFHDEMGQFKQVCWVHDSEGMSSMVALAWDDLFMKPNARLGGLKIAKDRVGFDKWQDENVRGKMTAAFMAMIKSFLEYGRYSLFIADAMVRPEFLLSATWKGREVDWVLDENGEYLVDGSDEKTTDFRAKAAEDFCISKGTVESLDDLALLLGYREYRVLDAQGEKICTDYVKDWRRCYEEAKVLFLDHQQFMGWATGADEVKYLGRAKAALEKILSFMDRYKAVEIRLRNEFGVAKEDLIVNIEVIKERLRAAKNNGQRGSGAGGGGSGEGGGRGLGGG